MKTPTPTQDVLTTAQLAYIFGVGQRTIIKLIDEGKMKAYRLPDSKVRRVLRKAAIDFAIEHSQPLALDFFGVKHDHYERQTS